MDVIQEVGAYAGFAAVVGLAVLAALYFSQARDLRRLREWAGRAPERTAEQAAQLAAAPEQAAQEAARPAASGAVRPIPAAKPAAAPKPATPGQPATLGQPATAEKPAAEGKPAAAPAAKPDEKKPDEKKPAAAPGVAPPVPATAAAAAARTTAAGPAPATPAAAPAKDKPGAPDGPGPATPPPRPPMPPPVLPARPAPPVRSPAAASAPSQSTAVLPAASARLRDRARAGRDGLGARYIALIVAGVIVVGGGAAFGISQLGGDDEPSGTEDRGGEQPQAPVNPSTVTVSVLNGTTVPGLAAQIGDEVESQGFQRGNVANALDQQRTASVVLFAEGADREAQLVGRRLGISTVEPIDPDSQALGGNASVVVIVGADQTQ